MASPVFGQVDSLPATDLSSPYHSIYHHLYYLQDAWWNPELAELALNGNNYSGKEPLSILAQKLKRYYDLKGYYIELDKVPRDPLFQDTLTNLARYYPVATEKDVYLERVGAQWLYSPYTVGRIETLYNSLFPPGAEVILDLLQHTGHEKLMGLYYWQHVMLLVLVIVAFILQRLVRFIIEVILFKALDKVTAEPLPGDLMAPTARPASWFLISLLLFSIFPFLQLPVLANKYLLVVLKAITPFLGMLTAYRGVDLLSFFMTRFAQKTASTLDDQLVPLVRKALKVFVVIIGVVFILQNLNFNITGVIAGLSIGGLAFALAAQDTIKNLFGSFMIFLDKPFQVGDWITSSSIDGEIEEVGFRSTRVRTFRNSLVYVPNGNLADAVIDNHGMRVFRRFYTRIHIQFDTPPALIEAFTTGLNQLVERHPHTRKDKYHVFLNDFGPHSLEIMFYIFFKVPNWAEELKCRHEMMLGILTLARELGIRMAYPTQVLHVESMPGQKAQGFEPFTDQELAVRLEVFQQKLGQQLPAFKNTGAENA